jgi:hypothetical protein
MHGGRRPRAGPRRRGGAGGACEGFDLTLRIEVHGLDAGYAIAHRRGGIVSAPARVGDRRAGGRARCGGRVAERKRWAVDRARAGSRSAVDNGSHDLDIPHVDRDRFARCPPPLSMLLPSFEFPSQDVYVQGTLRSRLARQSTGCGSLACGYCVDGVAGPRDVGDVADARRAARLGRSRPSARGRALHAERGVESGGADSTVPAFLPPRSRTFHD